MKAPRYLGKICETHPELLGERSRSTSHCPACDNARMKARRDADVVGARARDNARRAADPEAARAREQAYYAANTEKALAKAKRYYEAHAEVVRAKTAAFASRNPGYAKAYREANTDEIRGRVASWRAQNRPVLNAQEAKRRASKLRATPAWANDFFIKEAYALATLRTRVCGGVWEVDHIVPLKSKKVCGLHVEHNLRVIPVELNRAKGNRYWPDMPEGNTANSRPLSPQQSAMSAMSDA